MNTIWVGKVAITEDYAKKWSITVNADLNRGITEVLKNYMELGNVILGEHFGFL